MMAAQWQLLILKARALSDTRNGLYAI